MREYTRRWIITVNLLRNDHNPFSWTGLFRIVSFPCLLNLCDHGQSFGHLADQAALVLSVIFRETLNAQVRLAGETVQLERFLVFIALLVRQRLQVVFFSMLLRAQEAQSLTPVQASCSRNFQLAVLVAGLAQPFAGLAQFFDNVLKSEVSRQLVDDNMEPLTAECATQLKTDNSPFRQWITTVLLSCYFRYDQTLLS